VAAEACTSTAGHIRRCSLLSTAEQSDRFWSFGSQPLAKTRFLKTLPRDETAKRFALVPAGERGRAVSAAFTALHTPRARNKIYYARKLLRGDLRTTKRRGPIAPLPEPRSSLDAAVINDTVGHCRRRFGGLSGRNDESGHWYYERHGPFGLWRIPSSFGHTRIADSQHGAKCRCPSGEQTHYVLVGNAKRRRRSSSRLCL